MCCYCFSEWRFGSQTFKLLVCKSDPRTDYIHDHVVGNVGCIAPEYLTSGYVSTKTDVYSFGVLVLVTIAGRDAYDLIPGTNGNFTGYVARMWLEGTYSNVIDSRLDSNSSLMTRLVEIGVFCTNYYPEDRPTMEEVVDMLLGTSVLVSELRERTRQGLKRQEIENNRYHIYAQDTREVEESQWMISNDDHDTTAVDEFISDLSPR